MSGLCFAPGCTRSLGPWPPACRAHWAQLPAWLRKAISDTAPTPLSTPPPSPEYREAIAAAFGWFERQLEERAEAADREAALTRRITGEREE